MPPPRRACLSLAILSCLSFPVFEAHAAPLAPAPPPAPTVRQVGPWLLVDTPNFTICSTRQLHPLELGKKCEALRAEIFDKLTGEVPSDPWSPRCYVVCHPTESSYAREVGQSARQSRASSDVQVDQGRVIARRIDLRGDRPDPMRQALPHEMSHVVFADLFGGDKRRPLWADEGMAVLADIDQKQATLRRDLTDALQSDQAFAIAELLRLDGYPEHARRAVFYGQSVSLVEFFLRRKGGAEVFCAFLRRSTEIGYDAALEETYGIADVGELERLWKKELE